MSPVYSVNHVPGLDRLAVGKLRHVHLTHYLEVGVGQAPQRRGPNRIRQGDHRRWIDFSQILKG